MKTPRELLLERHAPADAKLDAVRRNAIRIATSPDLQGVPGRGRTLADAVFRALAVPWRELIWPARRTWAGFALAWLVIVMVNLRDADTRAVSQMKMRSSPGEMLMAWQQQQRRLDELVGPLEPPEADRPKSASPQPRSERHPGWSRA